MPSACPPAGRRASAARPTPRKPMVLGHNERMSRQPRWPVAAGLIAGVALDVLVGDPRRGHPVAAFGWAAARTDDVANWIPARVTAALTAACAPLVTRTSPVSVLNVVRRDGGRHPSPNAGRCEAAFA